MSLQKTCLSRLAGGNLVYSVAGTQKAHWGLGKVKARTCKAPRARTLLCPFPSARTPERGMGGPKGAPTPNPEVSLLTPIPSSRVEGRLVGPSCPISLANI